MSYKKLEIWERARKTATDVHRMSLTKLPRFELYELGSQIRRSAQSIRANIVEGYGRRRYKPEFIKHLTYALASCDETTDHLEALWDAGSLQDKAAFEGLRSDIEILGKKLNLFTQAVEREHKTPPPRPKSLGARATIQNQASRIQYRASSI